MDKKVLWRGYTRNMDRGWFSVLANLTEIKFPYLDPVETKLVSYLSPNREIPRGESGPIVIYSSLLNRGYCFILINTPT